VRHLGANGLVEGIWTWGPMAVIERGVLLDGSRQSSERLSRLGLACYSCRFLNGQWLAKWSVVALREIGRTLHPVPSVPAADCVVGICGSPDLCVLVEMGIALLGIDKLLHLFLSGRSLLQELLMLLTNAPHESR